MFCAKKGITIREYIVDTVLKSMSEESDEMDDETFKKAANKLMNEKSALWRKLADR